MSACIPLEKVNEGFLNARPLIAQTLQDKSIINPNFWIDVPDITPWPDGEGNTLQTMEFRGDRPAIEYGFDSWNTYGSPQVGCDSPVPPNCGDTWTMFGGHGFSRKVTTQMKKAFRTPEYCLDEIRTLYMYKDTMEKVIDNIALQTQFYKEFNIVRNYTQFISKKFVVASAGPQGNYADIYSYRGVGTANLSMLSLNIAKVFYNWMKYDPSIKPYEIVDGKPVYAISASDETFAEMFRLDPNARQDIRFSSYSNGLLEKYNFMTTAQGMFILVPDLYPRRANVVSGEFEFQTPFLTGVPAEVGAYATVNPAYLNAQYEEVTFHGRNPMTIFVQPELSTLGGNTEYGPQPSYMDQWLWKNFDVENNVFRNRGFFATKATIGLRAESDAVYSLMVKRLPAANAALFVPNPECPPTPVDCENDLPTTTCPCPVVLGIAANPVVANQYFITFASPVTGTGGDTVNFQLDSGAVVSGTLVAIAANGLAASFTMPASFASITPAQVQNIVCVAKTYCSSKVVFANDCRSGQTGVVKLQLERPLNATAGSATVRAYFGDCTEANLTYLSFNAATLQGTFSYAASFGPTDNPTGAGGPPATNSPLTADIICDRGGILKICVPTATTAGCPACSADPVACSGAQS